ncbi:hypothetical protein TRFO_16025 [Tritrichomonas foetus]|uniref:Rap-GAP domain-containing protein n=1 Tax=Tritrichomonas foetus TaxID=1144522 RepID=A0A1J4KW88_9EUKA|nr:hypothetical protein TRFO_16025 [Tritrichomonas foetus]|eukprot:OHT13797.1 hypothetical protein TRFO_16025 [Tritrichomonas foetus]
MKIANSLESAKYLISPNFTLPFAQESVLLKYESDSIKIATIAVKAATRPKDQRILQNEKFFNWIIQACGYALRIDDGNNHNSYFIQSLNLYLQWLKEFPFECEKAEQKERYIQILIMHISQIFLNPSYQKICAKFIVKIREALVNSKPSFSQETWSVILKVLFCGVSDLFLAKFDYKELAKVALDCLSNCEIYPDHFWTQFDDQLRCLFKYELFRQVWLDKFTDLYLALLDKKYNDLEDKSLIHFVNFFKSKIDSDFNQVEKQKAFTYAVYSWKSYTNKDSGPVHRKWLTNEIKKMFLPWFSPSLEWKPENKDDIHPLFLLIHMGEAEKDPDLHKIACEIIKKTIKKPKGEHSDLYWFLPLYTYSFFVKNQDLLKEISADFLSYTQEFKGSQYENNTILCIHVTFILTLLKEILKNDKSTNQILSQMLMTTNDNFLAIITSHLCLLFNDCSELFWGQINNCFRFDAFNDIIDILSLISGLSPHINGPHFADHVSLDINIFKFLDSQMPEYKLQRILLSLIFLSEGSNYFTANPDDAARLLEFSSRRQKNVNLTDFLSMLRLSLLCGGGTMQLSDELRSKKSIENFITENYVVSVLDENHLSIRHGLGITVFEVQDLGGQSLKKPTLEFPINGKPAVIPESKSNYVSECSPDPELMAAVEQMDALFSSNSDFQPYVEPEDPTNVSAAHSFLCDLGFISAYSDTTVKRVLPQDMDALILHTLDDCEPSPLIKIPILQVIEHTQQDLVAKPTNKLTNLLNDLIKSQTKVCRFDFVHSNENDAKILLKRYGLLVLLNETDNLLNIHCTEFEGCVVIALTPCHLKEHYHVDVFSGHGSRPIFEKGELFELSFSLQREKVSHFVTVVAAIYYSSPHSKTTTVEETNEVQSKGTECFVNGFKDRVNLIKNVYGKNKEVGRSPLLLEITQDLR